MHSNKGTISLVPFAFFIVFSGPTNSRKKPGALVAMKCARAHFHLLRLCLTARQILLYSSRTTWAKLSAEASSSFDSVVSQQRLLQSPNVWSPCYTPRVSADCGALTGAHVVQISCKNSTNFPT